MSTRTKQFPQAIKAVRHLKAQDPALAKVIEEAGPLRIEIDPEKSIYEALARSIFYQQVHAKAAEAILKRVQIACGSPNQMPTPEQFLRTPEAVVRAAGMSQSKFHSLSDLATRVSRGELPTRREAEEMTDEQLIEALTIVRGIGPWTVQMMLIFTFGRPDVWPVTDYGIRNGYSKVYGYKEMISSRELEEKGGHWRPYRSVASWYLWRATELERFQESVKRPVAKKPRKTLRS
jgi:3-methyladenine DNA glycosylase/8-oxoguanine DNA glycosylase